MVPVRLITFSPKRFGLYSQNGSVYFAETIRFVSVRFRFISPKRFGPVRFGLVWFDLFGFGLLSKTLRFGSVYFLKTVRFGFGFPEAWNRFRVLGSVFHVGLSVRFGSVRFKTVKNPGSVRFFRFGPIRFASPDSNTFIKSIVNLHP